MLLKILGFSLLFGLLGSFVEAAITSIELGEFILPSTFYNRLKTNWFGAWVLFIVVAYLSPYFFAFKLIVILFTIGRKDED